MERPRRPQEETSEQRLEMGKEGVMAITPSSVTASSKETLRNGKEFVYPEWRGGRRGEEIESERSQGKVMGALYMDFGLCPD